MKWPISIKSTKLGFFCSRFDWIDLIGFGIEWFLELDKTWLNYICWIILAEFNYRQTSVQSRDGISRPFAFVPSSQIAAVVTSRPLANIRLFH